MSNVNEAALRKQLSEATRMMVMAELLDYSGHLSARIPSTDQVLISCAIQAARASPPTRF